MLSLPHSKYKIEVTLQDKDERTDFNTSETTPPMPFNIGGWAVLKKAPDSYFFYNVDLDVGANIAFDKNLVNNFKIEANESADRTKFYLNGEFISVKRCYGKLKAHYRLGYGFQQRFWKGDIHRVSVYGDNNSGDWSNILLI